MDIQTEKYVEMLTDKPPEQEVGVATEFYLDRPPVPLFQPKMPAKENCKYTQIQDEDPELFDFEAAIEPMLNVLCSKTLEQARMMVLEEEELRVMKGQREEYEEVRNAELVEAQRLEASDLRRKQELERRRIQQKARKEAQRAAHRKYVARVLAKKHLLGLKLGGLRALVDQGMLVDPIEVVIHENVMPWLLEQMAAFIEDEDYIELNQNEVVRDAVEEGKDTHMKAIEAEQKRKRDLIDQQEQALIQKEYMRQARREARETRRIQQELDKLRAEIKQHFVDRGDTREHILSQEILDITGNFEKGKPFVGVYGGLLLQLLVAFTTLQNFYKGKEPVAGKKNPLDLLSKNNIFLMLVHYLKDMKSENLHVQVSQHFMQTLEQLKVNINDLHKVSDEQQRAVYEGLKNSSGHTAFTILNSDVKVHSHDQISHELYEDFHHVLTSILTKRLPADINFSISKLDSVVHKIRLVPIPKSIADDEHFDASKSMNKILGGNPNPKAEKAFVMFTIPQTQQAYEETLVDERGEEYTRTNHRMIDAELEDKITLVSSRIDALPYSVYVSNQQAARAVRKDILTFIRKNFAEYFEGRAVDAVQKDFDDMVEKADSLGETLETEFISTFVNSATGGIPLFDFKIQASDNE